MPLMSKVQAADLEDCEDSYIIFFSFGHAWLLFKINHNMGGVWSILLPEFTPGPLCIDLGFWKRSLANCKQQPTVKLQHIIFNSAVTAINNVCMCTVDQWSGFISRTLKH